MIRMSKTTNFNLGQLSITSNQEKPATPAEVSVRAKRLQNAQEAEAVLNFKGVADADYYEVYEKDGDNWRLLTGSSATPSIYQKLAVQQVLKERLRNSRLWQLEKMVNVQMREL